MPAAKRILLAAALFTGFCSQRRLCWRNGLWSTFVGLNSAQYCSARGSVGSAVLILTLTLIFGLFKPLYSGIAWTGIPFTLFAGLILSAGLVATGEVCQCSSGNILRRASLRCNAFLNALLDLKTVFFLSSPFAPVRSH